MQYHVPVGEVTDRGEITGDRAGESELGCSILDGVLAFDDATESTRRACKS